MMSLLVTPRSRALRASLLLLVCWAGLAPAHAAPAYDPVRRITLVPETLAFPTTQTERAVSQVDRGVHVLVYQAVLDGGQAGYTSATERQIEEVWSAWALAPGSGPLAFDPASHAMILLALDDREVRVRTGSRIDSELGLQGPALLPVIDRHFLAVAQTGDLDGALAALVRGLDGEIRRREANQRAAKTMSLVMLAVPWVLSALLLVALGVGGLLLLRGRARAARARFEVRVDALRAALAQGRDNLTGLQMDVEMRDQIVALKLKGPRTVELVDEVGSALAEIHAGLGALERRLAVAEGATKGAGPLSVAAWERGVQVLDQPLVIDTGEAQRRLFEGPTRVLEVESTAFMDELDARFQEATDGWARVRDAVAASLSRASADLTRDDLDGMLARLDDAGLPRHWVRSHPLLPDAEVAWARLDAIRVADPVAYLDALDDALEEDDALEAVVAELIGAQRAVHMVRDQAREAMSAAGAARTHFADPDLAPAAMQALAEGAVAALDEALGGDDLARVRATADEAAQACEEWIRRVEEVDRAVREAEARVDEATAAVTDLSTRRTRKAMRFAELLAATVPGSTEAAAGELVQAGDALSDARILAERARGHLAERRHLEAWRAAEDVLTRVDQAGAALDALLAAMERIEGERAAAERLAASLDAQRAALAAQVAAVGATGALDAGDALRGELEARWRTEAQVDWRRRLDEIERVIQAWQGSADAAVAAHARIERERAAQRRREAAYAAAAASSWSSNRSSTYRSSPSRSSGWSSAPSRSTFSSASRSSGSSRSSGRSVSSSSRSSGRSFSSSSRSGGRKF